MSFADWFVSESRLVWAPGLDLLAPRLTRVFEEEVVGVTFLVAEVLVALVAAFLGLAGVVADLPSLVFVGVVPFFADPLALPFAEDERPAPLREAEPCFPRDRFAALERGGWVEGVDSVVSSVAVLVDSVGAVSVLASISAGGSG